MRHLATRATLALALAAALSACGQDETSDPLQNVPDAGALTLEVKGGAAEGLAAAAFTAGEAPSTIDDLAAAEARVKLVNDAVREALGHVEAVVQAGGAPLPGEATRYGPVTRCVVAADPCTPGGTATVRLTVFRGAGSAWAFALEARVIDTWKPVFAGWMARGPAGRRGVGRVAVNFENLHEAAADFPGRGYLLGGFGAGPVAKRLVYRMVGFTRDGQSPVTAVFRGFKTAAGTTRVRVAGIADLVAGPNGDELGFDRVVWNPAIGGRAFALVSNWTDGAATHGDVPAATGGEEAYFLGRACYAAGAPSAPAFKEWFLCARGVGPVACIVANGGAGVKVAGADGATWQSTCQLAVEPPEFAPPAGAPASSPSDDSAEEAEASTGLGEPTLPADPADVAPPAT